MKGSLIDSCFKGNVLYSYGTQIASIGAGFLSVTLITRYAGIATYGMVSMMTALAGILSNLLTFRTNEAVVKFYKKGKVTEDLGLCRLAILFGLGLDLLVGAVLFLLMQVFAPTIATSLLKHPEMKTGVAIFAGVMLSTFLRGAPLGFMVAEERFRFINSLNVIEPILKTLLLLCIVVTGWTITFERIIWTMLLPSLLITTTVYYFPLREMIGPLRSARIPRKHLGDYARFSVSTFVSSSLKAGNQNIDSMILGYLTNPANVGFYNLFRQFIAPTTMIASPFSAQIYPRFVQAVAEKKPQAIHDTISHANRLLLRGFLLILSIIVPGLYIYGKLNNLKLSAIHYSTFGIMILTALSLQQLWWCRSFSLSVNPKWSVQAGILATIFMVTSVYFGVISLGLLGVALGCLTVSLVLRLFWHAKLGELL